MIYGEVPAGFEHGLSLMLPKRGEGFGKRLCTRAHGQGGRTELLLSPQMLEMG